MTDRGEARDRSGEEIAVPLFPLPATVLFPRIRLPFYVFEPRYRAMLAHVLDANGLLGIPMLRGSAAAGATAEPEIHPLFGVGRVENYETHEDGTSNIEVLGCYRVRVVEEVPSKPFRRARAVILKEIEPPAPEATAIKTQLGAALAGLERVGMTREARDVTRALFDQAGADVAFLVHMLATIVVGNATIRQTLLEEDRVADRAMHLITMLDTLRQELQK